MPSKTSIQLHPWAYNNYLCAPLAMSPMAKIHQPHDALLRRVFSTRKVVLALVKGCIMQFDPELATKATWDSFLLEKGSFLDGELQKLYGDLVGSVMVEGKRIFCNYPGTLMGPECL